MSIILSTSNYPYDNWAKTYPDHIVKLSSLNVHSSWKLFINNEMESEYFKKIEKFLSYCLRVTNGKIEIFPYPKLVFNAFRLTPINKIKVVILGQDPYINSECVDDNEIPQAMGLSFSVPIGITIPPSLKNIYQNLLKYGHITRIPDHGNLAFWAYQGCLMLNSMLTVQHKCSGSHKKHWPEFTDNIIKHISDTCDHVVFVLWGGYAYEKKHLIDSNKHKFVISSHPSPLSVNNSLAGYPAFVNQDHFKIINDYLKQYNKTPIIWQIA